jgi:hypothetical protein
LLPESRVWMSIVALAWLGAAEIAAAASLQDPVADDELARHLTTVRSQVENTTLELDRREELALEMAATLDRAAQRASDPVARRLRWSEAIDLLDWFLQKNADPPRERALRFQAGVFRWAQGRSWADAAVVGSRDQEAQKQAVAAYDNAIERLRAVAGAGNNPALAENVQFRLAEALADRADLEAPATPPRTSREAEALSFLTDPPEEPGLLGYWHLLKADLLRRSKRPAEAEKEVAAAIKAKPAPPAREIVEVNVPLLIELKRFTDAIAALQAANLDRPALALWMSRIRLAQLATLPPGTEHFTVQTELFGWIKELRRGASPERSQALLDLARAEIVPDAKQPPDAWDSMAEAYGASSLPAKAGRQLMHAAEQAAASGQNEVAAGYRLRAGGFLFQAGEYLEADKILSTAVDDPDAGAVRAKAGMLRCLARGRALAAGLAGASAAACSKALEQQLREFPTDPATNEARWLLGKIAVASGDRARAETLWSAIATVSRRWLDARMALAALDLDDLDRQQVNPERHQIIKQFQRADAFLGDSLTLVKAEEATALLSLARARLNLAPHVGRPEFARELCERVSRLPGSAAIHYRARLYRVVALVEMGRYVEAEREAQAHASWQVPAELPVYLDAVRLLDSCASTAESDVRQRRFGLILKLIVEPFVLSVDGKMSASKASSRCDSQEHCCSPVLTAMPGDRLPPGAGVRSRPTTACCATWATPTIGSKPTTSPSM